MPSKRAVRKAHKRNDPMVPIVGERVKAALQWRGISLTRAATRASVTRQAIANIVSKRSRKCRRSVRAAIAALCGRPISVKYLSGDEALVVPALSVFPTGSWPNAKLPLDGAGFPASPEGQTIENAPLYDLIGYAFANRLAAAPDLARSLGPWEPQPDVPNALRFALGLPLWREFLFEDRAWFTDAGELRQEATDFATHLSAALTVLLQPWLDGRTKMRPGVFRRWLTALDEVAGENMTLARARQLGLLSEFAILEHGFGDKELVAVMRKWRDEKRAEGVSEAELVELIRRGESSDDDI